ncbi:MAG TPA: N-6 DNA methylase [Humisphaera sp.]
MATAIGTLFETEVDVEAKLLTPLFTGRLGYARDELSYRRAVPFPIGSRHTTIHADIVVLQGGKPLITVEAKKPTEPVRAAMGQVDSYAFALRTPISVVTNGHQFVVRRYFDFEHRINVIDAAVDDLRQQKWKSVERLIGADSIAQALSEPMIVVPKPDETEIRNFRRFFRRLHNEIRDRDKLDPGAAFDELSKLLYLRAAEEDLRAAGGPRSLLTPEMIEQWERLGKKQAKTVVSQWFQNVVGTKFPNVFEENPKLNLKPSTLRELLPDVEKFKFRGGAVDVKGRAFEEFLPSQLRGKGLGQFFTPRRIVNFMAEMAGISIQDVVVDFSCGSGGFLIRAFDEMRRGVEQLPPGIVKRLGTTSERIIDGIRSEQIFGIDAEPRAARTAKMNMLMWGDGKQVVRGNALDTRDDSGKVYQPKEYRPGDKKTGCTLILANPPFGSREKDKAILKRYELGAKHRKRKAEKTEILFIEKGLKLLRPEGKMLIVLPQGLMSGQNNARVRDYIHSQAEVRAVISLPTHTFVQSGVPTVNTCILFVQKFTDEKKRLFDKRAWGLSEQQVREMIRTDPEFDYPIFMGTAEFVGYEPSGREIVADGEKTDLDLLLLDYQKQDELVPPAVDLVATAGRLYAERLTRRRDQVVRGTVRGLKTSFVINLRDTEDRLDPPYYLFRSQAAKLLRGMKVLGPRVVEVKDRFGKPTDDDLEREYAILSVSSDGAVTLNDRVTGDTIAPGYKRVAAGDIAYNPMRVNIGSIGVVPPELDGGLVSPDYVVVRTDGIDPQYLVTLLRSPFYRMYIDVVTTGSIRDRLYYKNLRTMRVPHAGDDEQKSIVAAARRTEVEGQELLSRIGASRRQLAERLGGMVREAAGEDAELDAELERLATEWERAEPTGEDLDDLTAHPAYQRIIAMGTRAVRFLLKRLEREPEHWFPALYAITGANPVPPEAEGEIEKMADAWIAWGREQGN